MSRTMFNRFSLMLVAVLLMGIDNACSLPQAKVPPKKLSDLESLPVGPMNNIFGLLSSKDVLSTNVVSNEMNHKVADYVHLPENRIRMLLEEADKYLGGERINQNYEKAVKLLEKAINLGSTNAMARLAFMYRDGDGMEKDLMKAVEWFEKAANLKDTDVMRRLAWIYRDGYRVGKDPRKAVEWFEKAVALGSTDAARNLAHMYRYGRGVKKDIKRAVELLEKAADLKDTTAMWVLAWIHRNGDGVEKDPKKAVEWFEKSAELGNLCAMNSLEYMYREGAEGVSQNIIRANELRRKQNEVLSNASRSDMF